MSSTGPANRKRSRSRSKDASRSPTKSRHRSDRSKKRRRSNSQTNNGDSNSPILEQLLNKMSSISSAVDSLNERVSCLESTRAKGTDNTVAQQGNTSCPEPTDVSDQLSIAVPPVAEIDCTYTPLTPVTSWLRGQGVRMIIFLDNILVLAPTIVTLNQHARMTISLLESLGFLIDYQKSTLVPTQKILFLEMLIDSSTMEFVLPKDKKENILRDCRYLLRTKQPSIRQISRVFGLLEFTRPAIWPARLPPCIIAISNCYRLNHYIDRPITTLK